LHRFGVLAFRLTDACISLVGEEVRACEAGDVVDKDSANIFIAALRPVLGSR
jgi:hypothetical protein